MLWLAQVCVKKETLMLIALDYDDTFTLSPTFWLQFVDMCRSNNHEVICCTMRTPAEVELMDNAFREKVKVYGTSRQAKQPYMQSLGIFPQVWIDDEPLFIMYNANIG